MSLADIVESSGKHHDKDDHSQHQTSAHSPTNRSNHVVDSPNGSPLITPSEPSASRLNSNFRGQVTTPSMRTGPPRSLSYSYSLPNSPAQSRKNTTNMEFHDANEENVSEEEPHDDEYLAFSRRNTDFRGALEFTGPQDQQVDRKGKKRERESRFLDEAWNPMKWFLDSPKDEKQEFQLEQSQDDITKKAESSKQAPEEEEEGVKTPHGQPRDDKGVASEGEGVLGEPFKLNLRRASSVPHGQGEKNILGLAKWGRLRSLLPNITSPGGNTAITPGGPASVTHHSVNITDELITGGLSTLMLRLWVERDEKGHRRVPVLLHRLRIRVSDSLHPLRGNKAVFRIECEYANGAARWVIYRQLRDFISLHTHYALSNAYNRNVDKLPEFPRTSLPYLKFLRKESRDGQVGQAEFARMQRQVLENYLIELIRSVMFHPSSNRLAGFLEISALFISLAQSGGAQYKAGFLQIEASGNKGGGGLGRKSAGWRETKEQHWCAIRESYLVVMQEPGELTVWDVFLLDQDFKIERPKRYFRQGLNLLHAEADAKEEPAFDPNQEGKLRLPHPSDNASRIGSIRSGLSKISHKLRFGSRRSKRRSGGKHTNGNTQGHDGDDEGSTFSSASSVASPMLDPSTNPDPLAQANGEAGPSGKSQPGAAVDPKKKKTVTDVSKHTFYIENSQMRLKLNARNERQMLQWITALEKVAATSHFTGGNRFDSFAPIRMNVAAQWLVDGRDYFWNLSRAILLARESIYIHDWWLSPELQMRRPNKERYRLDRLLERKAKEGVKIYIILYQEVSNRTTPTDSNYAKQRLQSLHSNVMIQRSPSHFQTGTFYWAHHEKMCVIDQAIAFMGGVDLCFGRWDTPQHILTDDVEPGSEASEIWPGKDYSNPRVMDFHALHKPEEDMYDRTKVPRMPWHDVGMQVVGQPARDLARHFVQRWNYLLRIKNHSRVMPFLLPPPEFKPGELTQMGLTGTCEMQICRSAGPWSLGTPSRIEHSIEHAYLKAIQMSEHFVYMENQFFITSTVVNDVRIENRIGDALVHRIIRAHREETPWKCCIMIPLLPGFTFPVDHSDASAIRIILECQNRTIARGPHSIFSRLRQEGINPDDYISVFSLRNWAKLRGDVLTTEQVYIHGKVCIVDDRLAIIGSANINERSQRGDRDSELAAVIRDTDMIDCTMAGKPFQVGRFAHTLRVRLMREHLGVNVDALDEDDLMAAEPQQEESQQEAWDPETEQEHGQEGVTMVARSHQHSAGGRLINDGLDGTKQALNAGVEATSKTAAKLLRKTGFASDQMAASTGDEILDEERRTFTRDGKEVPGFASSVVPTLEEKIVAEKGPTSNGDAKGDSRVEPKRGKSGEQTSQEKRDVGRNGSPSQARTDNGELFGAPADASKTPRTDDEPPHARSGINDATEEEQRAPSARSTIRRHLDSKFGSKTWTLPTPRPKVDAFGFDDPIVESFWKDVWVASAVHNTEIYRKVFHAVPDDLITTWKQYREFITHHERLNRPVREDGSTPEPVARLPSETGDEGAAADLHGSAISEIPSEEQPQGQHEENGDPQALPGDAKGRKPARGSEPFEKWERDEMVKLLGELNGHLVIFPNRFLEGEDVANNFLFNADRLLPLPIYN